MIVSALVKRYEDKPDAPVGWQRREVSYALDIDEDGQLLAILPLETEQEKVSGKKRGLVLPQEFSRSGKKAYETANFLCDNGKYMLGLDPLKWESTQKFHMALLKDVQTVEARAVIAYFNRSAPEFSAYKLEEKVAAEAKFVFQINGNFLSYEDEAIRCAWDTYYDNEIGEDTDRMRCLVTGKPDRPLKHHNVVHLRVGQTSGSRLISVNEESFASYGKTDKDRAADVGKYAAFAYVSALSDLLRSEKNHVSIGEDTLVYWAEKGGEAEEQEVNWWMNAPVEDSQALAEAVDRIAEGKSVDLDDFNLSRTFYLLCLAPAKARISVRFFHIDTFGNIVRNIAQHYKRLEIVSDGRTNFEILPPWLILSETTIKKSASDTIPLLGGQLLRSIILNKRYPVTLYHAILMRIRTGESINKIKAAVIKAVLIQNYNEKEVTTMALNEQSTNKPYVLGRLFAVLEKLQKDSADSKLNRTIRERYFTSASANPGSVFPQLLTLSVHHSAKLNHSVFYEQLKGTLLVKLDDERPFPTVFSLEDQGRFILGYYHQMQDLYQKKEKEEEVSNEE